MSATKADKPLPKRLQPALRALEKDLLERSRLEAVEVGDVNGNVIDTLKHMATPSRTVKRIGSEDVVLQAVDRV